MTTETTDKITVEKPEEHKEIDIKQCTSDIMHSLHEIAYDLGYMHGQQKVIEWCWLAAGIGMMAMAFGHVVIKLLTK